MRKCEQGCTRICRIKKRIGRIPDLMVWIHPSNPLFNPANPGSNFYRDPISSFFCCASSR